MNEKTLGEGTEEWTYKRQGSRTQKKAIDTAFKFLKSVVIMETRIRNGVPHGRSVRKKNLE